MDDVILSIYVPTYNHEKYIARALDSILMQKTEYAMVKQSNVKIAHRKYIG